MLKYAKIINEETFACEVGTGTNAEFYQSIGMTLQDVEEAWNGSWYLKGHAPLPTDEEQKARRASAYAVEVDPITAHIQRLKDESPIPEGEIAELIAEREAKVAEIKERYPYSVDSE